VEEQSRSVNFTRSHAVRFTAALFAAMVLAWRAPITFPGSKSEVIFAGLCLYITFLLIECLAKRSGKTAAPLPNERRLDYAKYFLLGLGIWLTSTGLAFSHLYQTELAVVMLCIGLANGKR
jgi:hypothetical protein